MATECAAEVACTGCVSVAAACGWCIDDGSCWDLGASGNASCASMMVGAGAAAACPIDYGTSTVLVITQSFVGLGLLLLVGHLLRAQLRFLRWLFLPACLVGGLVGLVFFQLCYISPDAKRYLQEQWLVGWDQLPGFLINIVFACMFMGAKVPPLRRVWRIAGPQLMYGEIQAWGQYALGALLTGIFFIPVYGTNPLIVMVLPLGFEGGHGTASGFGGTFETLGYPQGKTLSLASATVGLIFGVVAGTLIINWTARRGHLVHVGQAAKGTIKEYRGTIPVRERPIAGHVTVTAASLDVLTFHLAVIAMAIGLGYMQKRFLMWIESLSPLLTEYAFFTSFPLFPFCMIGGIVINVTLERFADPSPVDREILERISTTSLEVLTVAAIADMRLDGISDELVPFITIMAAGILWMLFTFFGLARWILPDHWAERGIVDFGQSTGVTATGLMLLRMADPYSETPARIAFSYKQLIHEPLVGAGIWTSLAPPLLAATGVWPVFGISAGAIALWLIVYFAHFRKAYSRDEYTPVPDAGKEEEEPDGEQLGHQA